ncbi:hypothetical protein AJ80_08823 [Polytolypa hystricis UAMH7299]|uniref:Uncharacterized protein n=1 Tax=Polytolypa hystricis (strain UAMH7299) TaxID=1447883 RepID=A0A2B7X1E5_POLH7|nr:hypothetical protein AJ80_08823 [Polytolypa hystricis UAMH7299]
MNPLSSVECTAARNYFEGNGQTYDGRLGQTMDVDGQEWRLRSMTWEVPHATESATFRFDQPGHKVLHIEDLENNEAAIRAVGRFCPDYEQDVRTTLNKIKQDRASAGAYFYWHPEGARQHIENLIHGAIRVVVPSWGDQLTELDAIIAFQRQRGWQIETVDHLESAVLDWYKSRGKSPESAYWCIVYSRMQGKPFLINGRYLGVLLDWKFHKTMVRFAVVESAMRIYEGPKAKLGKFTELTAVSPDKCL